MSGKKIDFAHHAGWLARNAHSASGFESIQRENEVVKVRCTKCFASTDFVFVDRPSIDVKTGKLKEETRYTPYMAKRKAIDAWNRRVGEGEKG